MTGKTENMEKEFIALVQVKLYERDICNNQVGDENEISGFSCKVMLSYFMS